MHATRSGTAASHVRRDRPAARRLRQSLVAVALTIALPPAFGQPPRSKPVPRARPPASWDAATADSFFPNAFEKLEGQRPATFAAGPRPPDPRTPADTPATGGGGSGGFKWSALVSEETLTDEIKDAKSQVAAAVTRPSDFKGGGYDAARVAFSSTALAFGVIAAYDRDVRWKKDAATARDLMARAGFNCKVGTDQTFAESKARLADLEAMLDGGSPAGRPERDDDFLWSQVAGRPALMKRLAAADAAAATATSTKEAFLRQLEKLVHEAEMVAAIGEAIRQKDFEFHDDDTYRGHAAAMRDAAVSARDAALKKDYDAARTAVGALKKSCDACHGEYRS